MVCICWLKWCEFVGWNGVHLLVEIVCICWLKLRAFIGWNCVHLLVEMECICWLKLCAFVGWNGVHLLVEMECICWLKCCAFVGWNGVHLLVEIACICWLKWRAFFGWNGVHLLFEMVCICWLKCCAFFGWNGVHLLVEIVCIFWLKWRAFIGWNDVHLLVEMVATELECTEWTIRKDENVWIQILAWNIISCHEIPGSHVYNLLTVGYGCKNSKLIYDRSLTLRSEMKHSILLRITVRFDWLLIMYVSCLAECLYSTRQAQPLLNNVTNSPDRSKGFILMTSQHWTKFGIYNCD